MCVSKIKRSKKTNLENLESCGGQWESHLAAQGSGLGPHSVTATGRWCTQPTNRASATHPCASRWPPRSRRFGPSHWWPWPRSGRPSPDSLPRCRWPVCPGEPWSHRRARKSHWVRMMGSKWSSYHLLRCLWHQPKSDRWIQHAGSFKSNCESFQTDWNESHQHCRPARCCLRLSVSNYEHSHCN